MYQRAATIQPWPYQTRQTNARPTGKDCVWFEFGPTWDRLAVQFAKKAGTEAYCEHPFDVLCHQHGIEHRLTKPFHPWTNGQVERMNRTIKNATTKAFHYASFEALSAHLKDYIWAYNSARPLRALKGKTPIGFILDQWHTEPLHFKNNPSHHFAGPNT